MISRLLCIFFCVFTLGANAQSDLSKLEFVTLNGDTLSLEETQGTFRVINFWATWCPPCVKEMPSLANLDAQLRPHNAQVIAINVGEDPVNVEAFLLENLHDTEMKILLDESGMVFNELGLAGLPMTYIVAPDGTIIDSVLGGREWDAPVIVEKLQTLADEN